MVDVEKLLAPVATDNPCGERLDYDADYRQLDELARGKPELRMGTSIRAAEPPDWPRVVEGAVVLLGRTKDLHVLILLARARLRLDGLVGFCDVLRVIRATLERYWDTVHPQLDRDDGNDPSERLNELANLADPERVLAAVRDAEVASARGLGRLSVRDLERAASGRRPATAEDSATPEAQATPPPPPADAVFAAASPASLARMGAAVSGAVTDLGAMEQLVAERTEGQRIPNLSQLTSLLQLVATTLAARMAQEASVPPPDLARADGAAPAPDAVAPSPPFTGTIRSRNDVLGALDGICAYYERFEPSSPIPLLLKRSRRLVAASFVDIVRDLVPDAVPHVEALRGKQE